MVAMDALAASMSQGGHGEFNGVSAMCNQPHQSSGDPESAITLTLWVPCLGQDIHIEASKSSGNSIGTTTCNWKMTGDLQK